MSLTPAWFFFFLLLAGFFHLRVPESSAVGSPVGRIKAHDMDIGKNAEVEYTIVPGDGGATFDIATNEHNQEGIIILRKVGLYFFSNNGQLFVNGIDVSMHYRAAFCRCMWVKCLHRYLMPLHIILNDFLLI